MAAENENSRVGSKSLARAIGAFMLYVLIQSLSSSYPEFGQYGWVLMGAYMVGAVFYLKYALRNG